MRLDLKLTLPPKEEDIYDVAIIGGGPAGLSAAQYAARAKLKTVVLDKSPVAGALGLTGKIENYPGVLQTLTGAELLDLFRQQAQSFGAKYIQTQVVSADLTRQPKQIATADGPYQARTVIIATGSMGRKQSIPGEAERVGKGVSYCATCDAAFFAGRDVAVIGDTEEAWEELPLVARFARTVYLVSSGAKLKESPRYEAILSSLPNLQLRLGQRPQAIQGTESVEDVVLAGREGEETLLPVAGVFIYLHGNQPIVDFLHGQLELTGSGCIRVDPRDMSTSVEGVYAAGDVTCKEIRQAVVAAAEGCIAALAADKFLHQRGRVRPDWA